MKLLIRSFFVAAVLILGLHASLQAATAPTITTQPTAKTVAAGANTSFAVVAAGSPSPTYQWQRKSNGSSTWSNLSNTGAYSTVTTATLTLTGATAAMSGDQFKCVVTNSAGSVTSSAVALTVNTAPTITTQPTAKAVAAGANTSFAVVAAGSPSPTYQWQRKPNGSSTWSNLSNAGAYSTVTTATLTLTGATAAMSGDQFKCVVTNSAGSVTSSAVTLTVNTAPSIATQPSSLSVDVGQGATFSVVAAGSPTLTYQWMKGGTNISGATGSNYSISKVTVANAGSYTVKVTNSYGSVVSSAATLSVNQAPVVQLTQPPAFSLLSLPGPIRLTAQASDADGSINKVEFYADSTKLGEDATSPYTFDWYPATPCTVALTAKAYDDKGAMTVSATVGVQCSPSMPYAVDFEVGEGFVLGSLDKQLGWQVSAGTASVVSDAASSGTQSILFGSGATAAVIDQEFGSVANNPNVVYVDFFSKLVAGADVSSGTVLDLGALKLSFVKRDTYGAFEVLVADGQGSTRWTQTASRVDLDGASLSVDWLRVSLALNFTTGKGDLYLNGKPIAANLAFSNTDKTYFSVFSLKGSQTAGARLDDLYVGAENPMFVDANKDGIDDAWETAHGLSLTDNNHDADPDKDGLANFAEYLYATDPQKADTDNDGLSDGIEVSIGSNPTVAGTSGPGLPVSGSRLHLQADLGIVLDAAQRVQRWTNLAKLGADAVQVNGDIRPSLNLNAICGLPAVHFSQGENTQLVIEGLMGGATAGEAFAVLRRSMTPNIVGLWSFGTGPGSRYPEYNEQIYDDFATDGWYSDGVRPPDSVMQEFHIYNVGGDTLDWFQNINANSYFKKVGNVVSFGSDVYIGWGAGCAFDGDIAEVIVFDRVLTRDERNAINVYLVSKYHPSTIPVPRQPTLSAYAATSSSIDLSWACSDSATTHLVGKLERKNAQGAFELVASLDGVYSYTDTGLAAGTSYTYRLRAESLAGVSTYSPEVSVSTLSCGALPVGGIRLWLRGSVCSSIDGRVVSWLDQSSYKNDMQQGNADQRPEVILNALNGYPVIRFNQGANTSLVASGVMQGATAGEAFVMLRRSMTPNVVGLWCFGTVAGNRYPEYNEQIYDDFATDGWYSQGTRPADSVLQSYHIYNVGGDGVSWFQNFNARQYFRKMGNVVCFAEAVSIGTGAGCAFDGDIAEIIVFDRVLSEAERTSVNNYLAAKYAPSVIPIPQQPTLSAIAASSSSINLAWTCPESATTHLVGKLERKNAQGAFELVASLDGIYSYTDTELTAGTSYTYRLRAESLAGVSPYSAEVTATTHTTGEPPVTVPQQPTLSAYAATSSSIDLAWTCSDSATTHLVGKLERKNAQGAFELVASLDGIYSYTDTGLTAGTSYTYRLRAESLAGVSPYSAEVTATTHTTGEPPVTVPQQPTLSAYAATSSSIDLAWTCSDSATTHLVGKLERKNAQGAFELVASLDGVYSYTDTGLAAGTSYTYRLRAESLAGVSTYSPEVSVSTLSCGALPVGGIRLWLRGSVCSSIDGRVVSWLDQSSYKNDMQQGNADQRPEVILNALNGYPVIRFNQGANTSLVASGVMQGATAGEAFVMLRRSMTPNVVGLWCFGTVAGNRYPEYNEQIYDDFATDGWYSQGSRPADSVLQSYHIYNVGGDGVSWFQNINAKNYFRKAGNVVRFAEGVSIGTGAGCAFDGDIAEVIVFDRVLSEAERTAVNQYLCSKYEPSSIPVPQQPTLSAFAATSSSIDLRWDCSDAALTHLVGKLERKNEQGSFELIAFLDGANSYTDTGLAEGTSYTYRLRAESLTGASPYSAQVSAKTLSCSPVPMNGIRLWLRASHCDSVGGAVSLWEDQSGRKMNMVQLNEGMRPQLVTNVVNGFPAVRFTQTACSSLMANGVMNGAVAGEVFAVLRRSNTTNIVGLWNFGGPVGSRYPESNGAMYDDFASDRWSSAGTRPTDAVLQGFHIYNVGGDASMYFQAFDGRPYFQKLGNTVKFGHAAVLGDGVGCFFDGDISEVLVFDHILTEAERDDVGSYLTRKYTLGGVPVPQQPSLSAVVVDDTTVDLNWTAHSQHYISRLERKTASGIYEVIQTASDLGGYTDKGLIPGQSYTYRVTLSSWAGESLPSSEVQVIMTGATKLPKQGMRLWLRASGGVLGIGGVSMWADQSGLGNNAVQSEPEKRPTVTLNALNGLPVVRFNWGSSLQLPDFMNLNATKVPIQTLAEEGEAFVVCKSYKTSSSNLIWRIGAYGPSSYPDTSGHLNEHFGSANGNFGSKPIVPLDEYHLYNVSAKTGEWLSRINGIYQDRMSNNIVGWTSTPRLGDIYGFAGDIAEIIIYDRVLTDAERTSVSRILFTKYSLVPPPIAPTGLSAIPLSDTRISLSWIPSEPTRHDLLTYEVERKPSVGGVFEKIGETNGLGFLDKSASPGVSYIYRVRVFSMIASGGLSSEVTVTALSNGAPEFPVSGLRLWLNADAVSTFGPVAMCPDQSGFHNDATQNIDSWRPTLVTGALNGRPVLRFDGYNDTLNLPDFMNANAAKSPAQVSALAGEVFMVLRSGKTSVLTRQDNLLWRMGLNSVGAYPGGNGVRDDFGSTAAFSEGTPPFALDQYHIYNVSSQSGEWASRMNGVDWYRSIQNTVAWPTAPSLGVYNPGYSEFGIPNQAFLGDIAEILIYDRVLTPLERDAIGRYLGTKYALFSAPPTPANLATAYVGCLGVGLTWAASPQPGQMIYEIERKDAVGEYRKIGEAINATNYLDLAVGDALSYRYRIRSRSFAGWSTYSSEISVTTLEFPKSGLKLWLDAGSCSAGPVASWVDRNDSTIKAQQSVLSKQPTAIAGALNGFPVVRFDGVDDSLSLANVLNGSSAGEVIGVVKVQTLSGSVVNRLWSFGSASGSSYYNDSRYEDFGSDEENPHSASMLSRLYHIADTSLSDGVLKERVNNVINWGREGVLPVFNSNPELGGSSLVPNTVFSGDVAEVFVFDRELSKVERDLVNDYLMTKYRLESIPLPPKPSLWAQGFSSNEVDLGWSTPTPTLYTVAQLERSENAGSFTLIAELEGGVAYKDLSVSRGATYAYRVRLKGLAGVSEYSDIVRVVVPSESSVLAGSNTGGYVAGDGAWVFSGGGAICKSLRGAFYYNLPVAVSGLYALDLAIRDAYSANLVSDFELDLTVDGMRLGTLVINAGGSTPHTGRMILPWLSAGTHVLKVTWHNGRVGVGLRIDSIQLVIPDSTDSDHDGEADWMTAYFADNFFFDSAPIQSYTSPFTVEGKSVMPVSVTLRAVNQTVPASAPIDLFVRQGLSKQFYADVPLHSAAPTIVTATEANGLRVASKKLIWAPFNLVSNPGSTMVVRKGSQMILMAYNAATPSLNHQVKIVAPDGTQTLQTLKSTERVQFAYDQAGMYKVFITPEGENEYSSLTVTVRQISLIPVPVLVAGGPRVLAWGGLPRGPSIQADPVMNIAKVDPIGSSVPQYFSLTATGESRAILRLDDEYGQIVDAVSVVPIRCYNYEEYIASPVATLSDGTTVCRFTLNFEGAVPPDLKVSLCYFGGAAFGDGSVRKTISASDFDSDGRCEYYVYVVPGATTCHSVAIRLGDDELLYSY